MDLFGFQKSVGICWLTMCSEGAAASNPSKTARTKRGGLSSDRGEEATEKTAENDWTILDPSKLNLTMISKSNHNQLCGFGSFC